jgi:hypothetical protein
VKIIHYIPNGMQRPQVCVFPAFPVISPRGSHVQKRALAQSQAYTARALQQYYCNSCYRYRHNGDHHDTQSGFNLHFVSPFFLHNFEINNLLYFLN